MNDERRFTRRDALKAGAAIAGAGALEASNLAAFARAWAQAAPWKPEKGAKLQLLRWKRFVQSEEDGFMALVAAFTKATGVPVTVLNESLDDVQPKASVAANTGQGIRLKNEPMISGGCSMMANNAAESTA